MKHIFLTPSVILALLSGMCGVAAYAGCPEYNTPRCQSHVTTGCSELGAVCDAQTPTPGGCYPNDPSSPIGPCSPESWDVQCNVYTCAVTGDGGGGGGNPMCSSATPTTYTSVAGYVDHYPCGG